MGKIEELLNEIKVQLKNSLTAESTPEEVNGIAALDSKVDEIVKESQKMQKDYDDLKELYINQVKNTGFKPVDSEQDDIGLTDTKSMDDVLAEELAKITAKA